MFNWDDMRIELLNNGVPMAALGYCKITFDAAFALGRKSGLEEAQEILKTAENKWSFGDEALEDAQITIRQRVDGGE